jgi:hypothetical protein
MRRDPDRLVQIGKRMVVFTDTQPNVGAPVEAVPILGIKADRFVVIRKGTIVVALLVADVATLAVNLSILRIGLDAFVVAGKGTIILTPCRTKRCRSG